MLPENFQMRFVYVLKIDETNTVKSASLESSLTFAHIQSCRTLGRSPDRPSLGKLYCIEARHPSLRIKVPACEQIETKVKILENQF